MSPGPDEAYTPLGSPDGWPEAAEDVAGAADAADRLGALGDQAPAWFDMVRQGTLVAAAYASGAAAGLYEADEEVAGGLLAGIVGADACGPVALPHVHANHAALLMAEEAAGASRPAVSEAWLRRVHAVACAPQVTHPVLGDHGVHDHVLGHGDYKHHPNDVGTAADEWLVLAPVDRVTAEMAALTAALASDGYAALDPVSRAAYALHALTHVGPFAAGNGRVARALASVPLFGATGMPLAIPPELAGECRRALAAAGSGRPDVLVDFVAQRCTGVVDAIERARKEGGSDAAVAAMRRWDARVRTAQRLQALVIAAADAALTRHRRRSDLGWMADLAGAGVAGTPATEGSPRFDAETVTLREAARDAAVQETLRITAHPVARPADVVVLRALEAELEIDVRAADVAGPAAAAFSVRLEDLLDRAVTALAVRVAAEADS